MKILVATASKHGSTREIGEAIADELRRDGLDAERRDVEDISAIEGYDAAVIGSAIYMGSQLPEARQFIARNRDRLATLPVWLFSSGPLGADDPQPTGDPNQLNELMVESGARGHRIFVGKLDKSALGVGERLIARVVKAPEGDFRDWGAIRDWADEIATTVRTPSEVDDTV